MKEIIRDFCQGIYDAMCSNREFIEKYAFEDLFEIVLKAFYALVLKVLTLALGIVACVLAAVKLNINFYTIFWVGITLWLCWFMADRDLKKAAALIRDISNLNEKPKE